MKLSRRAVFGATLIAVAASVFESQGQLGNRRDRQPAAAQAGSLADAVDAYADLVDWTPVAAVVVANNDPKNPWIAEYTPMLAEAVAVALGNAGMDAQLPGDTAFSVAGNEQDAAMLRDGTLLNLAQFMEADCLAKVALQRFSFRERTALNQTRRDYVLQLSVRIIDPVRGATRGGDQITVERTERGDNDAAFVFESMMDEAVAGVVARVGEAMQETVAELQDIQKLPSPTIKAYADAVGMTMPDVRKINGEWQMADSTVSVCPRFTLKIGGVALGTGPGVFDLSPVSPGLQMVEISATGFEPYRSKMFVKDGMTLNVSLEMTPAFRSDWLERVAFFSQLRAGEKLAEAQVEVMQGYAEYLRNSNYSVNIAYDHRSNIEMNLQHQYDSGDVGDADTFDEVAAERFADLGTELPDVNIGNTIDNSVTINDFSEEERAQFPSLYMGHLGL